MKTYQDLIMITGENNSHRDEASVMDFVRTVINDHEASDLYRTATIADRYDQKRNVTIEEYQKLLYTISGRAVPDNYSANWKIKSAFFHRFNLQEVQYLLGNGATWNNSSTGDKLGKDFDTRLQEIGHKSLIGGVAFGFFNLDHLEVFAVTEFAPLYDEENGALKAGVRFWQVAANKPLRATLYELDGYTDYIWKNGDGSVLHPKRPYIIKIRSSEVDGTEIYDFENYPTFPIVPLWANPHHQSEIVGLREQIDCYDLIKSGFANDIDDASLIYWTINNAGGMDDVDLAKFIERMHTIKAAVVEDDGAKAESHTMDVPYASREALLTRLRSDLYEDAMALDTKAIASGGSVVTAAIKAAYEPLNSKCDDFEYCIDEFLDGILAIAGIQDEAPTFTRSTLVNTQEEISTVVSAAQYLDSEYVTRKILNILGDGDQADDILKKMDEEDSERMTGGSEDQNPGENPPDSTEGAGGASEGIPGQVGGE